MSEWDDLFANLRRNPFGDDPNGIPQEIGVGNGNIDSQGYLSDNSVVADVIRTDAVIARHITSDTIETRHITADAVTANEIAANTITANEIAANTITAAEIAANTITASEIAANTITANEITANSITTSELAANAVITENILAANVTSSRIELTISGKKFGANDGSAGAPGLFFDAESNMGIWRGGTAEFNFSVGGAVQFRLQGLNNVTMNDLLPDADNAVGLGGLNSRYTEVWAVDGTINTSDAREKRDIEDSPLGLDFVRSLRPRTFKWRDVPDTQARESVVFDADAMAQEAAPYERRIREIRQEQLAGTLDEDEGNAEVERLRAASEKIRSRHLSPAREAHRRRRPGRRPHYGLIAQEVKEALDAAGVDAAFWKQAPDDGLQALSYSELMAPLIMAVQELAAQNEALAERVDLLEGA